MFTRSEGRRGTGGILPTGAKHFSNLAAKQRTVRHGGVMAADADGIPIGNGGEHPPADALDRLIPDVYDELREIAHRHLARVGDGASLQTTALVHEAYLKLASNEHGHWSDRAHFLAVAAVAMRRILIDRARSRSAVKRGGPHQPITLDENVMALDGRPTALLQVNDALERLAAVDARLAPILSS
ncbi:hypothetical protein BH09GEM1_BH09GEM1_40870 [soil metagenome]